MATEFGRRSEPQPAVGQFKTGSGRSPGEPPTGADDPEAVGQVAEMSTVKASLGG